MTRSTIDFGIDLGTTNSAIAVLNGMAVEIIKNNDSGEITPSCVYRDRKGRLYTGYHARQHLEEDPDNAKSEFKRNMGIQYDYEFKRSGARAKPEELSAEILKSLKADVQRRLGENLEAAVITVPAAFELPQCEATNRAARLAGFRTNPLIQEPVAAALAHGFQTTSNKVFWLVYDIGGGTFDAAVMQVRDGEIQVVNHAGDNHLGGKDIDWEIVDKLLVPALTRDYHLTDFRRGNDKWISAFGKLKSKAEEAKIILSHQAETEIFIDDICVDDRGETVQLEYELSRQALERLAEPTIRRSIQKCRELLREKRLDAHNLEKVILVGGPTLMPGLRERLADNIEGLGLPLDFSIDPLTVVARGAAVFAGTQRLSISEEKRERNNSSTVFTVAFPNWNFVGSDTDPLIAGRVSSPATGNLAGYNLELINQQTGYRSGKLALAPNGGFMTTLFAEEQIPNVYSVQLQDPLGTLQEIVTDPETLSYKVGLVIKTPPLLKAIGIELVNNEIMGILEAGTPLPGRKTNIPLRTTVEVRPGQAVGIIRIPVIEGNYPKADRNKRIGKLEIMAHQVRRTIPVGSEIELTVEIDESRLLKATAYIPVLDEEFEQVINLREQNAPDPVKLKETVQKEKARLETFKEEAQQPGNGAARKVIAQLQEDGLEQDIDQSLGAAGNDPDAAAKGESRLLELKVKLDQVEEMLEWPTLVKQAENLIVIAHDEVKRFGKSEEQQVIAQHVKDVQEAIASNNRVLLIQRNEELVNAIRRVLQRVGILDVIYFQRLCKDKAEMRNQQLAERLIASGVKAMNAEDSDALRAINRQLIDLLPSPPPPPDASTVMRG